MIPLYDKNNVKLWHGDALEVLKSMPNESVDCCITSPPYWAVRDFGDKNQIGLEEHPQEYIDKIVKIMKELKRIIKKDGSIWLNLGDSYYSKSGSGQGSNYKQRHEQLDGGAGILKKAHTETRGKFKSNWLQNKQRLLIPSRIAIKCQDELGLILRNDIHWVKQIVNIKSQESFGCAMPTSIQDRLNTVAEFIFFFVKQNDYYFNLDEIRIPHKLATINRALYGFNETEGNLKHYSVRASGINSFSNKIKEMVEIDKDKKYVSMFEGKTSHSIRKCPSDEEGYNIKGRNPGDCLMFPFEPSKLKHFAMFPSTLPLLCILAGCPQGGVVLDPFGGTMTTGVVAIKLGRKFWGIDINKDYLEKIAIPRIEKEFGLFDNPKPLMERENKG